MTDRMGDQSEETPDDASMGATIPQQEVDLLKQILAQEKNNGSWLYEIYTVLGQVVGGLSDLGTKLDALNELLTNQAVALSSIDTTLVTFLTEWEEVNEVETVNPPVGGTISLAGGTMALTVDTTPGSESVDFVFDDDHGNETSAPTGDGSGLVVTLASADGGLTSVGATTQGTTAAGNPNWTAPITVVTTTPGTAEFSVSIDQTSGVAVTEDDGTTPFPAIPNESVPIVAGNPVTGSLTITP